MKFVYEVNFYLSFDSLIKFQNAPTPVRSSKFKVFDFILSFAFTVTENVTKLE